MELTRKGSGTDRARFRCFMFALRPIKRHKTTVMKKKKRMRKISMTHVVMRFQLTNANIE